MKFDIEQVRRALYYDRFLLLAQPIIQLQTGAMVGCELLLRMRGNDNELVPPEPVLQAASEHGMLPAIDRWVIRRAMEMSIRYPIGGRFWVNISGESFENDEFLKSVQRNLETTGAAPSRFVLEVTESSALSDIESAAWLMKELKSLGFEIALDDFGVGYASLAYLKSLPVDYIKIDGSFVRNITADRTARLLVRAVAALVKELGKEVVAESIETSDALEFINSCGIAYGQGYLFSRPRPLLEVVSQVAEDALAVKPGFHRSGY